MVETILFVLKEMLISILISSSINKIVPEPSYDSIALLKIKSASSARARWRAFHFVGEQPACYERSISLFFINEYQYTLLRDYFNRERA
jgi:hypothetical protein